MWRSESQETKAWFAKQAELKKLEHAQRYPGETDDCPATIHSSFLFSSVGYAYTPNRNKVKSPNPSPSAFERMAATPWPASSIPASGNLSARDPPGPIQVSRGNGHFFTQPSVLQSSPNVYHPYSDSFHGTSISDCSHLQQIPGQSTSSADLAQSPFAGGGLEALAASVDEEWHRLTSSAHQRGNDTPSRNALYTFDPPNHPPLSAPAATSCSDFPETSHLSLLKSPGHDFYLQPPYSDPHGSHQSTSATLDIPQFEDAHDALFPSPPQPYPLLPSISSVRCDSRDPAAQDDIVEYLAYRNREAQRRYVKGDH